MYKKLSDVPADIRRFYKEVETTVILGYDEETLEPITEVEISIVLDTPPTVTYDMVSQRRYERKSDDVVRSELEAAMLWEDYDINYNQYLQYKEDYATWSAEQPTMPVTDENGNTTEEVVPPPSRPEIDLDIRREHYFDITSSPDLTWHRLVDSIVEYDDSALTKETVHQLEPRPVSEIIDARTEQAVNTRLEAEYADIRHNGHYIQVGRGRDGTYGITKLKNVLTEVSINPEKASDTTQWITADNSVTTLSFEDVKAIISEFNTRQQSIYVQYATWRESGIYDEFVVSL